MRGCSAATGCFGLLLSSLPLGLNRLGEKAKREQATKRAGKGGGSIIRNSSPSVFIHSTSRLCFFVVQFTTVGKDEA
jgi:hypothetical protein